MPRTDIEFKTTDGVTLRGWFYRPAADATTGPLPCIVLVHGFAGLKEMDLDAFADRFSSTLPVNCLVYDNRGYGSSDTGPDQPLREVLPDQQVSDMADAITYAQSRTADVDAARIAIWGSSYAGGHVLRLAAIDKRVKTVLSQVACVDGYATFQRLVRADFAVGMDTAFTADRIARAAGADAARVPVMDEDPLKASVLPTPDSYVFFSEWAKKGWINDCTLRSVEAFRSYNPAADIHRISPTPLLMTVAANDVLTPTDLALEAYSRAREPKALHIIPGGHFDAYLGPNFERNVSRQIAFLKEHFL